MAARQQSGFFDELRKIPPVTRFLCASQLGVSLPVMLHLASPYKFLFVLQYVTRRLEIWRLYTSFFLGGSGINFIFELVMLYRGSDQLESGHYMGRSHDYAWQLFLSCLGIHALTLPLRTFVHTRALLLCLTQLSAQLAPPGAQTSVFGLLTLPYAYLPYLMIGMDLVMSGPSAAATSVAGAIVGHAWWYTVFQTRTLEHAARAPAWVRRLVATGPGGGAGTGAASGGSSGVHVVPPRAQREATQDTGGYRWGTGNRLGTE